MQSILLLLTPLSFLLLSTSTSASITLHYFGVASCNANTALGEYNNPNSATMVTDCIAASQGTIAVYVDGIDDGCSVRVYTDPTCTTPLSLSLHAGTCYFQSSGTTPIVSWRAVCAAIDPTVTISPTMPAGTVGKTGEMPGATPSHGNTDGSGGGGGGSESGSGTTKGGGGGGAVVTSVEIVTASPSQIVDALGNTVPASPPTDGAPTPTVMRGNGNGTGDWNYSRGGGAGATRTGKPGLQGVTNVAGRRGGEGSLRLIVGVVGVVVLGFEMGT